MITYPHRHRASRTLYQNNYYGKRLMLQKLAVNKDKAQ